MFKINFKSLLPHLVAIITFILVIFAYFPELLDGKALNMGDIEQHKGMSNELADYREKTGDEAIWTNAMFGGMPGYLVSVVYHGNLLKYVDSVLKLGLPRPAGYMFTLMLGFYILLQVLRVNPWVAIVGCITYCLSTYNLLIMEAGHMSKVDAISWMPWVVAGVIMAFKQNVIAGALLTALALSLQIKATHYQVTYYMSFFLIFYAVFEVTAALRSKNIKSVVKPVLFLIPAVALAVLSNISSIYTIYDYGKDSIRGKSELTIKEVKETDGLDHEYALQYSYGIGESFSYLIPDIYGGSSTESYGSDKKALEDIDNQYAGVVGSLPKYWGSDSSSGPFYAGALVCFLFVLGFFVYKQPLRWAILATVILALMLSWGKNFPEFSEWMLDHFPAYNKFRAVKMILILTDFLIPLLAALALDQLIKNRESLSASIKNLYWAFGLTGGVVLLIWLSPSMFFDLQTLSPSIEYYITNSLKQNGASGQEITSYLDNLRSNIEPARAYYLKADAMRAFVLILFGAGLCFLYLKKSLQPIVLTVVLGLIMVGDLWSVDKRYVNSKDFISKRQAEIPFEASDADVFILQEKVRNTPGLEQKINERIELAKQSKKSFSNSEFTKYQFRGLLANTHYRVLNLSTSTFNDAATSFFHKSVGGYSAAKLERYQEFIEYHLSKNIQDFSDKIREVRNDSMLKELFNGMYAFNMLNTEYVIFNPKSRPVKNPSALGNAWFVKKYEFVSSADDEIRAMKNGFNPAELAYIDKRFESLIGNFVPDNSSSNSIELTSYSPKKLTYKFKADSDALAVFSEVFYAKGWNAFIDGQAADHFRCNYILRGMKLPKGEHELVFEFIPESYVSTEKIAFASSGLILLLSVGFLFWQFRKNKQA